MTIPRLGDQIVFPPTTQIVTDPAPASAPAPRTTPSGLVIPHEPEVDMAKEPVVKDGGDLPVESSILTEDGSRRPLGYTKRASEYRVRCTDNSYWEHTSDAADGEWVYRQVT